MSNVINSIPKPYGISQVSGEIQKSGICRSLLETRQSHHSIQTSAENLTHANIGANGGKNGGGIEAWKRTALNGLDLSLPVACER
jgi:hypothetical protein